MSSSFLLDFGADTSSMKGIVGLDSANEHNITGVAPEASLLAYKVFGCNGETTDDSECLSSPALTCSNLLLWEVLIASLVRAVNDGADVINLSLGEARGWSTSPISVVASRLADMGKVVVVAAGNYVSSLVE
jgi:subtilisin family serine protease